MEQKSMNQLGRPPLDEYKRSRKLPVTLILDNVRSGLNVGAIFRTCDAFAIEAVVLCGITVQPPHTEIMKTALGATESVEWKYVESSLQAIEELKTKHYRIIAIEQTNQSVFLGDVNFNDMLPVALIFGNEMRGVGAEVLAHCDSSIEIPQEGIKHSLNVATSAGIVLWECYRQCLRLPLSSSIE